MQAYDLIPHPAFPPSAVTSIEARINTEHAHWVTLRWRINGAGQLQAPAPAGKRRADGLWQTTCFELFLHPPGGEAYIEFNLSPSEQWNAYDFDGYRAGMKPQPMSIAPVCAFRPGTAFAIFDASIPKNALPQDSGEIGLSAIIEEHGGRKSYWAIAHPSGDQPDFHDRACFAARLRATGRT